MSREIREDYSWSMYLALKVYEKVKKTQNEKKKKKKKKYEPNALSRENKGQK